MAMEIEPTADPNKMFLNLGPQHPAAHGVLRLLLEMRGEIVLNVTPIIGQLHRGFEKLCESRAYVQIIPITDRLDYVSSMSNNYAYVKAVEELAGIEVLERAQYIRVIMLELQRIASHLFSAGIYGHDLGAMSASFYTFRERELILDLFESVCGARLTYSYMRFGGVRQDLPPYFVEKTKEVLDKIESKIPDYVNFLLRNEVFLRRTQGVGILKPKDAVNLGATGPVLRGSGVAYDVRKADPYLLYDQFDWEVVTQKDGDCLSRFLVYVGELRQSIGIVRQALKALPEGDLGEKAAVPKALKPPPGEVYSRVENPRGELGFHIISDGSGNPYRLKVRSPTFCNLSILPHLAKNVLLADMVAILGTLDPVFGEIDR